MIIDVFSPEILIGGGAAVGISFLFFYFLFFKSKKKAPPTRAQVELEELKQTVAKKSEQKAPQLKTLSEALSNTQKSLWGRMSSQLGGADPLEAIEEVLYTSDLGPKTVQRLYSHLQSQTNLSAGDLREALKKEIVTILNSAPNSLHQKGNTGTVATLPATSSSAIGVSGGALPFTIQSQGATVWMVVGVNGAGKTTTIGKLASQLRAQGKKVLIAAGDTFRAAADEQLKVWSQRADVEIFSPENTKDPSAVAFDAVKKGVAQNFDVVIVDTAGRLHTQKNLMEELKKMKRVMDKAMPGSPHEVILVLDANSGQNALVQAEQFHQALGVTGVILTKMDGSAKGGVAVGVACDVGLAVKMIGIGEAVEDLRPFSAKEFADSIL